MMAKTSSLESSSAEYLISAVSPAEDTVAPAELVAVHLNSSSSSVKGSFTIASGDDDDDHSFSATEECFCVDAQVQPEVWTTSSIMQHVLELMISIGISLLFGGLYLVRTLIFSYVVHYLILLCSSLTEAERWIPQHVVAAAVMKGSSSRSWPPPTLIGLALLTIFMMIIHPDGFTWIFLYKIRDGVGFILQTTSTCWSIVVHDYGTIVSTLMALATFAALFFFIFVLHRTLASKTPEHRRQHHHSRNGEKHRRKKRKCPNARGLKTSLKSPTIPDPSNDSVDSSQNDDSHLQKQSTDSLSQPLLPPLVEDEPLDSPPSTGLHLAFLSEANLESSNAERSRTESSTTVDSGFASSIDDQSSCSGRSTPTPALANEKSQLAVLPNVEATSEALSPYNLAYSRRGVSARRSGKKYSSDAVNSTAPPPAPMPSKRWDALKPTSRSTASIRPTQRFAVGSKKSRRMQSSSRNKASELTEERQPVEQTTVGTVVSVEPETIISFSSADGASVNSCDLRTWNEPASPLEVVSTLNPHTPSWTGPGSFRTYPTDHTRPDPRLAPQLGFDSFSNELCYTGSPIASSTVTSDNIFQYLPPQQESSFPMAYHRPPSSTDFYGMTFSASPADPPMSTSAYWHSSRSAVVPENPFASCDDDQIEADLQALGGRMVDSMLDF